MTSVDRHAVTRWGEKKNRVETFHWSCRTCKKAGSSESKSQRDIQVRHHKGEK